MDFSFLLKLFLFDFDDSLVFFIVDGEAVDDRDDDDDDGPIPTLLPSDANFFGTNDPVLCKFIRDILPALNLLVI